MDQIVSIPFIDLDAQYSLLKIEIDEAIASVLSHGQYIMGPEVQKLEEELAEFVGVEHCVGVSSGTDALLIALMALGVGPGDEVITSPFTFAATAEVILLLGAKPVFVDIEIDSCNIDASRIEELISEKTKAILPVSLYGQPSNMRSICELADRYSLAVVEDAAQSFGASHHGVRSCGLSLIGCTSFFPSKPLGCYGDGGAIFTSDSNIAQAAREIRVHGQEKRYLHSRLGVAGRLDTIQAAILRVKLRNFEKEIEARSSIAQRYDESLDQIGIPRIRILEENTSVYAQYTVFVENREAVQQIMLEQGIPTAVHYPVPLNNQPAYRDSSEMQLSLPVAERASKCVLSLPMSPYLRESHQDRVIASLSKISDSRTA